MYLNGTNDSSIMGTSIYSHFLTLNQQFLCEHREITFHIQSSGGSQVSMLHISSLYLGSIILIDFRGTTTSTTANSVYICTKLYKYKLNILQDRIFNLDTRV